MLRDKNTKKLDADDIIVTKEVGVCCVVSGQTAPCEKGMRPGSMARSPEAVMVSEVARYFCTWVNTKLKTVAKTGLRATVTYTNKVKYVRFHCALPKGCVSDTGKPVCCATVCHVSLHALFQALAVLQSKLSKVQDRRVDDLCQSVSQLCSWFADPWRMQYQTTCLQPLDAGHVKYAVDHQPGHRDVPRRQAAADAAKLFTELCGEASDVESE